MKRFWISWYARKAAFEYYGPWWISGWTNDWDDNEIDIICAAVLAESEEQAKATIQRSHYNPELEIEWRFCTEKSADWSPFSERFPRASWMVWEAAP